MSTAQQAGPVYALLADGSTVQIRPAEPGDFDAVKAMHEAMSPDNAYFRFFILSRTAAETEARWICQELGPGRVALLALAGGEVVGCASYETLPGQPDRRAEVAFAVADHMHHRGIATLLLEHLVSYASSHQITTFTGQTLAENTAMLKVFADAGPAGAPSHRGWGRRHDHPAAQRRRRHRSERLPERGGRAGAPRGRRQPAARVRTRVGRGDRRQPAAGHGGPGDLGQYPHGRVCRPPVRGQPARRADRRRAQPGLARRPARAARPGGDRRTLGGRARRGRAVRAARRARRGGDHFRAGRRRPCRPARDMPPSRHAAGRPELLRRRGTKHWPGRHLRRQTPWTGHSRPGHAVRRPGHRRRGPAVPAGHRDLLVRVGGRQARRVQQRHADVVGARRRHQARRAVHRVVRQPAQVREDGPQGRREHACARGGGRAFGGRAAGGRLAHRGLRHPAGHDGGPVPAGRRHHGARLRRRDRDRRAAGHPARPVGQHGRDRVQHRRRRGARGRRLHRPRPDRPPAARADPPPAARAHPPGWSGRRPDRHHRRGLRRVPGLP